MDKRANEKKDSLFPSRSNETLVIALLEMGKDKEGNNMQPSLIAGISAEVFLRIVVFLS